VCSLTREGTPKRWGGGVTGLPAGEIHEDFLNTMGSGRAEDVAGMRYLLVPNIRVSRCFYSGCPYGLPLKTQGEKMCTKKDPKFKDLL